MSSPEALRLQQRLREKIESDPAPTPDGTPQIFWARIASINSGPPATVDVIMATGATVPGLRYDASLSPSNNLTVWGYRVGANYFVVGARK